MSMNSKYYITSFVAGFILMTVELTASRICAPIIGSSIFTWTSVIGSVLLGLSIGSLIGGKIIDKYSKNYSGEKLLSFALLISSLLVYLIIPLSKIVSSLLDKSFSIMSLSIIVCFTLFLLPSIAIGSISPIIFHLYVSDINNIGKKYAILSSLWSLGSILGVFVTGFYFISRLGSSITIYVVSVILFILFLYFYTINLNSHGSRLRRELLLICILIIIFLAFLLTYPHGKSLLREKIVYEKETEYYRAMVVDYDLYPQYGKNRWLFLDIDSHSIQMEKATKSFYTDIYPVFSIFSNSINKIHIIGAGAYTLPINLKKYYYESEVSVSEIDPELEKIGNEYFNLKKYDIKTETIDARVKFSKVTGNDSKYDLIYGDAYNSFISVPWHLLTKEFLGNIKSSLNTDGIYAINFIGSTKGTDSVMFESVYSTLNEVFPNNQVFTFGTSNVQNITVLGINNNKHMEYDEVYKKLLEIKSNDKLSQSLLNKDLLNNGNGIKRGFILTDDFSPIEYMMNGLIKKYFSGYYGTYKEIIS